MVASYVSCKQYLQVIRDVGITLNMEKCDFGKPEVKLMGHIVGTVFES